MNRYYHVQVIFHDLIGKYEVNMIHPSGRLCFALEGRVKHQIIDALHEELETTDWEKQYCPESGEIIPQAEFAAKYDSETGFIEMPYFGTFDMKEAAA